MNRSSWAFLIIFTLIALMLGGCSGGVYTASRNELDGDPVVIEGMKAPSPVTSVETFWTPNQTITTPPPIPNNVEILKQSHKEEEGLIHTSYGDIRIKLYDKVTPKTVENFKVLVNDRFYDQTTFHRVVPGFVIQGGDPLSRDPKTPKQQLGTGGPNYTIVPEIALPHIKGAVAMARLGNNINSQKNSNGSQFYICLETTPFLDGEYTVFGQVIEGMDVVEKISQAEHDDLDIPRDRLEMTITLQKSISSH